MVVNRKRKVLKHRGHTKHGYGRKSKHRGSGSRGGRGNSGHGKRGHARKPSSRLIRKGRSRIGFVFHGQGNKPLAITLAVLDQRLDGFVAQGKVALKAGVYEVDLATLGFDKVLGTGRLGKKLSIKAAAFSTGALAKIKAAGGSAELLDGKEAK